MTMPRDAGLERRARNSCEHARSARARARRAGPRRRRVADHRLDHRAERREHARERTGVLELRDELRIARELGREVIDDEVERAIRHALALVTAAAPARSSSPSRARAERLLDQRGLADARRPGDEHEPARAAAIVASCAPRAARARRRARRTATTRRTGRGVDRLPVSRVATCSAVGRRSGSAASIASIRSSRSSGTFVLSELARGSDMLLLEPRQHVQRPAERRRAGDELERDDAERVDVHRRAHREPLDVLGREVRGGADDPRLARELLLGAPPLEREAEVEQLDRGRRRRARSTA